MISVIITNYNTSDLLINCLRSLYQYNKNSIFEVIVVDNNSSDDSVIKVKKYFPNVKLINLDQNLGFSRANNIGAKYAAGEHLLFINSDTQFIENSLNEINSLIQKDKSIGIIGPKILNTDFTYQISSGKYPGILVELFDKIKYALAKKNRHFRAILEYINRNPREVDWVTGACMIIPKSIFEQIEGFDENIFMYFEDKDLCHRIKNRGYRIVYYPHTKILHHLAGSTKSKSKKEVEYIYRKSQLYYYQKYCNKIQYMLVKIYQKIFYRT